MLMESRHTVVWCGHSCSQIVPHILSGAGFCVLGFRWVIGRILHNLWINNVPVLKAEVVEHCTACNNIWHKDRAHFQGLEEDGAPACLQHPKGSRNNVMCTSMLGVEASLYRILYRLSVWCDEADGRTQTGIPTISKEAFSCRWIQAASVKGAVLQHSGIMHRPGIPDKDVDELPLVVGDGLQLD